MCTVEITMLYAEGRLEIRFDRSFQPVDLTLNVHLRVITSITPSTGKSAAIVNILQFACNNKDECDRRFFFDHVDWLLNAEYDELTDIIRPLIAPGTKSAKCIVDDENNLKITSICRACAWTYSSITKQNKPVCYEENWARTELSVVTNLILSEEYQYKVENDETDRKQNSIAQMNRIIQYWCKPDWCTNGSVVQQMNETVQNYYDLSPLYQALNIKNRVTSTKSNSIKISSILTSIYTTSAIAQTSATTLLNVSTNSKVQNLFSSDDVSKGSSIFTSQNVLLTTQSSDFTSSDSVSALMSSLTTEPKLTTAKPEPITAASKPTTPESISRFDTTTEMLTTIATDITTTIRIITSTTSAKKIAINSSTNIETSYSTVSINALSNVTSANIINIEKENKNTASSSLSVSMNLLLLVILLQLLAFFNLLILQL